MQARLYVRVSGEDLNSFEGGIRKERITLGADRPITGRLGAATRTRLSDWPPTIDQKSDERGEPKK